MLKQRSHRQTSFSTCSHDTLLSFWCVGWQSPDVSDVSVVSRALLYFPPISHRLHVHRLFAQIAPWWSIGYNYPIKYELFTLITTGCQFLDMYNEVVSPSVKGRGWMEKHEVVKTGESLKNHSLFTWTMTCWPIINWLLTDKSLPYERCLRGFDSTVDSYHNNKNLGCDHCKTTNKNQLNGDDNDAELILKSPSWTVTIYKLCCFKWTIKIMEQNNVK